MGSRLEANSNAVRKRIEQHRFDDEEGEEYEPSKFGGFTDYFRRKKIKLQNLDAEQRRNNADKPQIFRGVVAHVNGYTQPSLNDLHTLIVSYGGGFLQYLDGKTTVTHVIASNLTPKKKVEFRRYRIVKPAWVVDSIQAGKLLPWDAYRVVDEGVKQNVLGFQGGNLTTQTNSQQIGYREQTNTSWYTNEVRDIADRVGGTLQLPDDDAKILENWPDSDLDIDSSGRSKPAESTIKPELGGESLKQDAFDDVVEDKPPIDSLLPPPKPQPIASGNDSPRIAKPEDDPFISRDDEIKTPLRDMVPQGEYDEPNSALQTTRSPSKGQSTPNKPMTAEDHNAILLTDPRMWKSTGVNPGFLKQYYEESRLHHLSAWKADLKSKLQALAEERSSSQKARQKRPPGARRYILHVDFDSFFAAVSLKQHPEWIDKPAVVAHGGGAGSEIASCNYPARKFGVKNGMWMKTAQQLCSELKVLPYDFKAYEDASKDFYEVIMDTGGIVQSVSVDEALLDMSLTCIEAGGHDGKGIAEGSIWREQAKANEVAEEIRAKIKDRTGCAVSVGIGANILLAKLALRKAKPAGQYQIKPEEVLQFIGELTVQDLPGVAYSIGGKLEEVGVKFIKDVRELSKEKLITTLGPKTGEKIFEYARGIDKVEVGDQVTRKSVSAEVNWGIRFVTQEQADDFVRALCEELHKRLVTERVKGRQVTMKIMRRAADAPLDPPKMLGHGKCDVFNKSTVLGVPTNDKDILSREALSIMKSFNFSPGELRGIGVQMTKLEPLKSTNLPDSSQRRLQFKMSENKPTASVLEGDDIVDSPQKAIKSVNYSAITRGKESDGHSLLNTMGTQFVLPSQVDPSVLAELPEDIRSKLTSKLPSTPKKPPRQAGLDFHSRNTSPTCPDDSITTIPSQSQLDPETLAALPSDIREEILASYRQPAAPIRSPQPSSPRKPIPKKLTTPTKKRTTLLSRSRGPKLDPNSTLTQSNFLSRPETSTSTSDAIDAEFLAALPPDIRAEVLAQQRQSRLQSRGGLSMPAKPKRNEQPAGPILQRRLRLEPRLPKPTFTARKLSSLPELRDAVSEWVTAMEEETPEQEDVDVLRTYLGKVVVEEKDMGKAVSVVKWMVWVVKNMDEDGRERWKVALARLKDGVNEAIRERGLGPVEF